jgi:hypothetical protein
MYGIAFNTAMNSHHYWRCRRYDIGMPAERELALERLRRICEAGLVSVTDFRTDPRKIFAAHECAALCDPSLVIKMTVQVSFTLCTSCSSGYG